MEKKTFVLKPGESFSLYDEDSNSVSHFTLTIKEGEIVVDAEIASDQHIAVGIVGDDWRGLVR